MFADDTNLVDADEHLETLIRCLKKKLEHLLEWCKFNNLDLNWSKTYLMFITNKELKCQPKLW